MAKSVNKVILLGNLAKDPELRYTAKGTAVVSFTLVTDRTFGTGENKKTEAEYTRCVAWGKLAEVVSQYLKKGSKAYAMGRLQTRSYETEGTKKYVTEVIVDELVLLSGNKTGEQVSQPLADTPEETEVVDDLPF